jgi:hypothetical protein
LQAALATYLRRRQIVNCRLPLYTSYVERHIAQSFIHPTGELFIVRSMPADAPTVESYKLSLVILQKSRKLSPERLGFSC